MRFSMEKQFLQLLIRVSKKIAIAKVKLGVMADEHPIEYMELRNSLNAIIDEMAEFCDCPPTKLIFGKKDEICGLSTRFKRT